MKNIPISVKSAIKKLGKDIKKARLKRRVTMEIQAERAGISRITLSKIEKGEAGVSIGAYTSVLFTMGMENRLRELADPNTDYIGQQLEEENLPKRVRYSK
jgi:transcriptional regulator with XRE-family HTH domain